MPPHMIMTNAIHAPVVEALYEDAPPRRNRGGDYGDGANVGSDVDGAADGNSDYDEGGDDIDEDGDAGGGGVFDELVRQVGDRGVQRWSFIDGKMCKSLVTAAGFAP